MIGTSTNLWTNVLLVFVLVVPFGLSGYFFGRYFKVWGRERRWKKKKPRLTLAAIGIVFLVAGIVAFSAIYYGYGPGKPPAYLPSKEDGTRILTEEQAGVLPDEKTLEKEAKDNKEEYLKQAEKSFTEEETQNIVDEILKKEDKRRNQQ